MASRTCLTPGTVFAIYISPKEVSISADLTNSAVALHLSKEDAERLEDQMHDALEGTLEELPERIDEMRSALVQ